MSTVHRTVISIRALFGGLDASVLPGLVDGEKRNLSSYDKILERDAFEPDVRAVLERQRERIHAAIVGMEAMEV